MYFLRRPCRWHIFYCFIGTAPLLVTAEDSDLILIIIIIVVVIILLIIIIIICCICCKRRKKSKHPSLFIFHTFIISSYQKYTFSIFVGADPEKMGHRERWVYEFGLLFIINCYYNLQLKQTAWKVLLDGSMLINDFLSGLLEELNRCPQDLQSGEEIPALQVSCIIDLQDPLLDSTYPARGRVKITYGTLKKGECVNGGLLNKSAFWLECIIGWSCCVDKL